MATTKEAPEESSWFMYTGGDQVVPKTVERVKVNESVRVIPPRAFEDCTRLREMVLPEGLCEIGAFALYSCKSLSRINFPRSLRIIKRFGLRGVGLKVIDLNEGLEELEDHAFFVCHYTIRVNLPSTLRLIGEGAFENCLRLAELVVPRNVTVIEKDLCKGCESLSCVTLSDGIVEIKEGAFGDCPSLVNVPLPSSLKHLGRFPFGVGASQMTQFELPEGVVTLSRGFAPSSVTSLRIPSSVGRVPECLALYGTLISLEMPDTIEMGSDACVSSTVGMSLRNVALPFSCEGMDDETIRFSSKDLYGVKISQLCSRFEHLPIHKVCYYQSYCTAQSTLQVLGLTSPSGNEQDCLGMTPLHILLCSAPKVEICQAILQKYPGNLIARDRWNALPMFYALWTGKSDAILKLCAEAYRSAYPEFQLNWEDMLEAQALADNPSAFKRTIATHKTYFSDQSFCLDKVLYRVSWHTDEDSKYASNTTFTALVEACYAERVNRIGIRIWRSRITEVIDQYGHESSMKKRHLYLSWVNSKYREYELKYHNLKEGTTQCELALWHVSLLESVDNIPPEKVPKKSKLDDSATRAECRVRCRAEVVINHVLRYLDLVTEDGKCVDSDEDLMSVDRDSTFGDDNDY